MAAQGSSGDNIPALVEERFFPIVLAGNESLIKSALEHALGVELESLARGFWVGRTDVNPSTWFDITVRALPVEGGTAIEIRVQPRWTPAWAWLYGLGIAAGCVLIVPLIFAIIFAHRRGNEARRKRLVLLHRVWTELAEAVGAPLHASDYRGAPRRIYEPAERNRIADGNGGAAQSLTPEDSDVEDPAVRRS